MAKANRYTLPDLLFACTVEDGGLLPSNAAYDPLPPKPWVHKWPKKKTGTGWEMVSDHRERKAPYFPEDLEQEGTPYWLPSEGDDWQSPPRTMKDAGPLPEGHSLTRPEKPLAVAQDEKRNEISTAHAEVLAYMLAERPTPTPVEAALAVADMGAEDPSGLAYVRALVDARRAELLAQVDAARSLADVEAVVVSYPV